MNDILTAKISTIKNCLTRIKEKTNLNPESIENDFDIQDIFVLNLQRAIQATIDISNYIIKENNLDLPKSYKNAFEILYKHSFIDKSIKDKMIKMAGFRNIAIHDYQTINIEILKSILSNNLEDLQDFYIQIIEKQD